jgi:hypothetical protein
MSNANRLYMRWLMVAFALAAIAAVARPILAQSAPPIKMRSVQITGVPEDWSFHHLVFSDPGSAQDATQAGRYNEWLQIVNDPRYIMQQLKRNNAARGPFANDVAWRESLRARSKQHHAPGSPWGASQPPKSTLKQDWSEDLTTNAVLPNTAPAKYTFNPIGAPSCTDFVVFPTGYGDTTDASIIAYYNLYATTCSTGTNPEVWGAYNTYSIANGSVITSPVLSSDGTKVAYIQGSSTNAYLVVLKMPTGGETSYSVTMPYPITSASTGMDCTAPCATATSLIYASSGTVSSPFYDYANDAVYVGDNDGYLYKISPVFNSTSSNPPTVTGPIQLSAAGEPIASPVYDSASGCVFVGDTDGYLYSVNSGVAGTVCTSTTFSANTTSEVLAGGSYQGILDGVLVDPSAQTVYAFVAESGGQTGDCASGDACLVQFTTTITSGGSPNRSEALGTGLVGYFIYAGTFDNVYFSSSTPPSGNIWVVGNPGAKGAKLYQVPIASNVLGTPTPTTVSSTLAYGWATPVTEFCNNAGSACAVTTGGACGSGVTCTTSGTDTIYFSVYRGTVGTTCSNSSGNGCVLAFNVNTTTPSLTGSVDYTYPAGAGCWGTGAFIIDNNSSVAGASQVYDLTFNGEVPPQLLPVSASCGATTTNSVDAIQLGQSTLQ